MNHLQPLGRALGLAFIALVVVATPVHADNCSAAAYGADAPAGQDGACGDTAGAAGWLAAALAGIAGLLTFGGGGRGPWAEGSDFSALKETRRDIRRQQGPHWTRYAAHGLDWTTNAVEDYVGAIFYGDTDAMDRVIEGGPYGAPEGQDAPAGAKPEVVGNRPEQRASRPPPRPR